MAEMPATPAMRPPVTTPGMPATCAAVGTSAAAGRHPGQQLGRYDVGVSASVVKGGAVAGGWVPRNSIVRDALQVPSLLLWRVLHGLTTPKRSDMGSVVMSSLRCCFVINSPDWPDTRGDVSFGLHMPVTVSIAG